MFSYNLISGLLKFYTSFGDDEIDYELFDFDGETTSDGYQPALKNCKIFEASSNRHKNIQFGLTSHDSGLLYLTAAQKIVKAVS